MDSPSLGQHGMISSLRSVHTVSKAEVMRFFSTVRIATIPVQFLDMCAILILKQEAVSGPRSTAEGDAYVGQRTCDSRQVCGASDQHIYRFTQ